MANNLILEKLHGVKARFVEVGNLLTDSSIMSDMDKYVRLNKEYRDLEPIIAAYEEYKNLISNIDDAKSILSVEKDEEMREMAKAELDELWPQVEPLEEKIKLLLIPKDPEDDKSAILEIRAGSGGDEASLFAGELMRMYVKYAESKGWKTEVTRANEGTVGGYKEIVLDITGHGVYGIMKYES
ncbi:MAG: PCRF domain-containing protein, partial [Bacteroidales bacterium]|nr:PCRF domain-containing protein [Bacteroidales bacterium]